MTRAILSMLMLTALGACGPGDGQAESATPASTPISTPTSPQTSASESQALAAGLYVSARTPLVLRGAFRTRRQFRNDAANGLAGLPTPGAEADIEASANGTPIEREYWADLSELPDQLEPVEGSDLAPTGRLSIELHIDAGGLMPMEFVNPPDGKLAMNGGRRDAGESYTVHAVAATSREPMEFVLQGLPAPVPGSLVCRFDEYLDDSDVVASRLSVSTHEDAGAVGVRVAEDGAIAVFAVERP